jgi:putative MATE family efflux protein
MKHVAVMSFTASIGLMAIFAVDFIDMIFISMLGNAALAAAIGYAGTVMFFTTSIAIGFSIAAGALVAKAIGRGENEAAREHATTVMAVGLISALITLAIVFYFRGAVLSLLGASGETFDLAIRFLNIVLPSMPIMMAAIIASALLRAHGDAKRPMYATLAAGAVNAILDPILIFGLDLGLDGAAIATVLARITLLITALYPAFTRYNAFALVDPSHLKRDIARVASIAIPAVLANIATPVGSALVTRELARYGTDAVAGMAIIGRLTPVAFAVIFALSGAIGPIIGQNFGAGYHDRVKETFKDGTIFALVYVLFVSLVLYLSQDFIIAGFNATGDTATLIMLFCGPLALSYFFNGYIFVGNAAFNNLGHPFYSTAVNWGRHTIGTWPLIVAGGAIAGASGVLIGQAIGGVVFALISGLLSRKVLNNPQRAVSEETTWSQQRWQLLHHRKR